MITYIKVHKKLFIILLAPFTMLMLYTSSMVPGIVDALYSRGVYKLLSWFLGLIIGLVGFSLAEMGLLLIPFVLLFFFVRLVIRLVKYNGQRKKLLQRAGLSILMTTSLIYFLFVFLWGFNYSREPVSRLMALDIRPASLEELVGTSKGLIAKANKLRAEVSEDTDGVMFLTDGKFKSLGRAPKGFDVASNIYPFLGGSSGAPKGVIMSEIMSYTGISGVFCPFTGEAHVNTAMPDSMIPSTACHEMAHARGFSREDEANYISYLVSLRHPDKDYQYSGVLLGLINCMNALYNTDREAYQVLRKTYSSGINRDLVDLRNFWSRYEGPVERASNSINNAYLKANMQKDGVKSYDRMVNLLIAEYRKEQGT